MTEGTQNCVRPRETWVEEEWKIRSVSEKYIKSIYRLKYLTPLIWAIPGNAVFILRPSIINWRPINQTKMTKGMTSGRRLRGAKYKGTDYID